MAHEWRTEIVSNGWSNTGSSAKWNDRLAALEDEGWTIHSISAVHVGESIFIACCRERQEQS